MKFKNNKLNHLLSGSLLLLTCSLFAHSADPSGRIFVSNEKGNSISVINGQTLAVEATVEIGDRPRGVGLSPDRKELYVAVSEENAIAVMDPKTLKVLRKFKSGSDPETFAVHPNGHIYISNEDDAKASVYDPKNGQLVAEIQVGLEPEGVAISPDGKKVIITSESTNMLHVIAVPEHKISANILVGARPRAATFTHDNQIAYSSSEISGEIKKVSMKTNKVIKVGQLPESNAKPKDVLLSKDEKKLYVAGGRANKIYILDPNTLDIIKGIPVGKRTWGLAMNRDGSRLFTTDGVSGTVSVIDTQNDTNIKTINVGKFPWGVVVDD